MSPLSMPIFLSRSVECLVFSNALRVNADSDLQPCQVAQFHDY